MFFLSESILNVSETCSQAPKATALRLLLHRRGTQYPDAKAQSLFVDQGSHASARGRLYWVVSHSAGQQKPGPQTAFGKDQMPPPGWVPPAFSCPRSIKKTPNFTKFAHLKKRNSLSFYLALPALRALVSVPEGALVSPWQPGRELSSPEPSAT